MQRHACFLLAISLVPTWSAADDVRFNRDVRPILSKYCFSCHGPDATHREAELRLDVADSATKHAIVPRKPDESELVARVTSTDPDEVMPPPEFGKSPSADEIRILRKWIAEGAEYEGHWAFLPPQRPAPPVVPAGSTVHNPVDRFVLARLRREGLQPTEPADRATLIRRVSVDLTGLPPTPEEVAAFVHDERPDAYEKVVDRLLGSRRYAEHMARLWLDAARYADTNGYQYDLEREQWVWRDWVIDAYDRNVPFDRFTVEQIAGDLLTDATDQTRLATAFHRNHPITIEGGVIDEEYRTEYVVDRVATTSTVWLGLTMTCCRCHDHKYDPVTQREFYEFFAFFNNVPEKGHNGFNPKITAPSPFRSSERQRLGREIVEVQSEIDERLAASNVAKWETELADSLRDRWGVVSPDVKQSRGGATFEPQPDGSLLATGKNPATDVYTFEFDADRPVHAVRVEALTHESFVGGGTGRGSNANFVLGEFTLATSPADEPAAFAARKIARAEADYEQSGYPLKAAVDGNTTGRGGWAVDGNTKRENRTAVFHLAEPVAPDSTGRVRVELHFSWGGSHTIGRVRLAAARKPLADAPADVVAIVGTDAKSRTPDQSRRLSEYLATRFGSPELRASVERGRVLRSRLSGIDAVPATMVMAEMPNPRTTHVLFRGEYDKPRDVVTPGTPAALPPMADDLPRNRLGLARWLVRPDHPLTSRVAVNRLWQQLFGVGLVRTAEDFGAQGEYPTHPDLLDWLAVEFVESGWDTKAMLKTIVLSAAYQRSSRVTPESFARDPENRLLARGPRLRLDAEVIRDSALFSAGLLSDHVGGPSVFPYHPPGLWQEINNRPGYSRTYKRDSGEKLYRRSLYTFWKRTVPPPSMAAFDAPEREFCVVRRSRTNTPLQAFVMLNDPQFVEAARHLGSRMIESGDDTDTRLVHGFQLCFARTPSDRELAALRRVVERRLARYTADEDAARKVLAVGESPVDGQQDVAEQAAWASLGRTLLNLSEFVTKP